MARLNTCEQCGHYSWVHKGGKCGLDYCSCGKEQVPCPSATPSAKEAQSPPSADDPALPQEP